MDQFQAVLIPELFIEKKCIEIIIEILKVSREQCSPEAKLFEDLGADVVSLEKIISALEHNFHITVTQEDFKNICTVRDMINHIIDIMIEVI